MSNQYKQFINKQKEKPCKVCGKLFLPNGPAGLYCKDCAPIMAKKAENIDYRPVYVQGQEREKLNIIGKVVYRMNGF